MSRTPASAPSPAPSTPNPGRSAGKTKKDPHLRALDSIRFFLESKSCYDILPESFRLIVFDTKLSIMRSLQALITNGVVSAPLYDSTTQRFAGMFTLADVVHLIQYYYLTANEYENVIAEVDTFKLESLRHIEQTIDVPPPPTISVHPDQTLADACAALVRTHARRLPLVDTDGQMGKETIISVLTQYRVLKFIAINCQHDCARLDQAIGSLGIGSFISSYEHEREAANGGAPASRPMKSASSSSSNIDRLRSASATPIIEQAGDMGSLNSSNRAAESSKSSPEPQRESALSNTPSEAAAAARDGKAPGLKHIPSSTSREQLRHRSRSISRGTDAATLNFGAEKYFPLATATLQTSVFDVVHIFSERGISAVPIVDDDGVVLNLYETVDIVDLVRMGQYDVLDATIEVALRHRSPDFTGVITCTAEDSLASVLAYVRERRVHRFVVVAGQDTAQRRKGSLIGILSLSDVLRYLVGHHNLKGHEVPGLGVHGLRGVADSMPGGVGNGSRRGSETTDAGSVAGEGDAPAMLEGLALKDILEEQAA